MPHATPDSGARAGGSDSTRADVRKAFVRGLRLGRAMRAVARALVLIALGVCAYGWLRSELERRDLATDVLELGVERLELAHRAQSAECRVRVQHAVIRSTEFRLTLPPETLTTLGETP